MYDLEEPSLDVIEEYNQLDNEVPPAWRASALCPTNEEDARNLNITYQGEDRLGPSNAHNNDPSAFLLSVLSGPDFKPPLPDGFVEASVCSGDPEGMLQHRH